MSRPRVVARASWRGLWHPGLETATLSEIEGGWRVAGHADLEFAEGPTSFRYRVDCTPEWAPRHAEITIRGAVRGAEGARRLGIEVDAEGRWTVGGFPNPDLRGCTDLDLAATPSTNTLAMNRLALPVGASREILVAWVLFPDLEVRAVRQRYTRMSERHFRFEAVHNGFVAEFDLDEHGLVTDYPRSWERVRTSRGRPPSRPPHRGKARASRLK